VRFQGFVASARHRLSFGDGDDVTAAFL
jgi:hypothetical protein